MIYIIIIHGPSGVGKSTITIVLREKLPTFSYVDRPYIKRGLKPAGKEFALSISKKASYIIVRELIEVRQNIITEEINPESMTKHIGKDYIESNGYKILSFYLTCDLETAVKRDMVREAKTVGREGITSIHENYTKPYSYENVIDTGKVSVEKAIDMIIASIK